MTANEIKNVSLEELIDAGGFDCECGRRHGALTKRVIIRSGAVDALPALIKECSAKRPFLLSGKASFAAAGEKVCAVLDSAGIEYKSYVFPSSPVKPTEETVGAAVMNFDRSCDLIIGIGSGVINDTGKLLAAISKVRYIIVGTAPSMDGYASATSSMERGGLKVSLDSAAAWAVIGDTDILKNAPMNMLVSGVGDMLAKYISLAEWRIANIICGEYYCPTVAALVETALQKVVSAAPMLIKRDKKAVEAVMEGMMIAGIAMKYAGLSRPASGMEHYFSHIWDMRALAFADAESDLHGIQCGIATLYSLKIYDFIRSLRPDREKARAYARRFSPEEWNEKLRAFIGPGAEAMIAGEKKERKYDPTAHEKRLAVIIDRWDDIMAVIETLPRYDDVLALMNVIGAPTSAEYLGYDSDKLRTVFTMTKDIRDKYVASRLLWDLGELENAEKVI